MTFVSFTGRVLCGILLAGSASRLAAAGPPPPAGSPGHKVTVEEGQEPRHSLTNPNVALKWVEPGIFEIGKVRLDQRQRTVRFPAVLNMDQGPMEYFLVTGFGKTHESIFRTDTEPHHIHVAMLLLGATSATNTPSTAPGQSPAAGPDSVVNPSKIILPGDRISVELHWKEGARDIRRSAEDIVLNVDTRRSVERRHWVYNGSMLLDGLFLAQAEGSIISLVTDPAALVNNTGRGHDNDKIWIANTNRLPPFNTPVEVLFKLEGPHKPDRR